MTTTKDTAAVNFKTTPAIKDALRAMAEHDHRTLVGQLEFLVMEEVRRRAASVEQVAPDTTRDDFARDRSRPVSRYT